MNLQNKEKAKRNKGFYIALGVCLIAVGIAAWTTYSSVTDYTAPKSQEESQAAKANDTVSGIFVTESNISSAASASEAAVPPAAVSSSPEASSAAPASSAAAKETAAPASEFVMPVSGSVLQAFSRKPVYNKTLGDYRAHAGTDLSAKAGDPVCAMAAGTVVSVSSGGQYGGTVVIDHSGVEIQYCGLDKILVKEKQAVAQKQRIGTVGINPAEAAEESHLHLTAKKDGQYFDPMSLLK